MNYETICLKLKIKISFAGFTTMRCFLKTPWFVKNMRIHFCRHILQKSYFIKLEIRLTLLRFRVIELNYVVQITIRIHNNCNMEIYVANSFIYYDTP